MYIKYIKETSLALTTRKRYSSNAFPIISKQLDNNKLANGFFRTEEQKKISLGDGVNTSVKTKSINICDYVIMGTNEEVSVNITKWFVVYYEYLNGGQIILYLRRDIIGEKGLTNLFGKVDRGYLDNTNVLINRKELSVNEILKNRVHLKTDQIISGYTKAGSYNVSVSNNDEELWGIFYFVKDRAKLTETFDIPEFSKVDFNLEVGDIKGNVISDGGVVFFDLKIAIPTAGTGATWYCRANIRLTFRNGALVVDEPKPSVIIATSPQTSGSGKYIRCILTDDQGRGLGLLDASLVKTIVTKILYNVAYKYAELYNNNIVPDGVINTTIRQSDIDFSSYDGKIAKSNGRYYNCSISQIPNYQSDTEGNTENSRSKNDEFVMNAIEGTLPFDIRTSLGNQHIVQISADVHNYGGSADFEHSYYFTVINYSIYWVNFTEITSNEANAITLEDFGDIVDEPFFIMAMPLYSVNIDGYTENNLSKENCFKAFNSIIKGLSGENSFLIDAQIVPYAPELKSYVELKHYTEDTQGNSINDFTIPLFYLKSSSYERVCTKQFTIGDYTVSDMSMNILKVFANKKKEYCKKQYSIVSPEQSGKIAFNFYDYVNSSWINNNTYNMRFIIKIALKPYSVIASCIIDRGSAGSEFSLEGITYNSDMRGCQPNSGGFQASLASDQFQTYKRQNSNYQQIFNKQQEMLGEQHKAERVSEVTQGIMNTIAATVSGAMAGQAMTDAGIWGDMVGAQAVGAITGAATFGVIAAGANIAQGIVNEHYRQYEYKYKQDMFDLSIGTIKNLPLSVNRISSFNEIILKDFWFCLEVYECTKKESDIIDTFIENYGYAVGVYGYFSAYATNHCFVKGEILKSDLPVNLHQVAESDLGMGIYYYE